MSHPAYSCGYGDEYHVLISYFPNSMQGGCLAVCCGDVGMVSAVATGVDGTLSPQALLSASTAWLEGKHSSGLLVAPGVMAAAKAIGPTMHIAMLLPAKLYPQPQQEPQHREHTRPRRNTKQPTANQYI